MAEHIIFQLFTDNGWKISRPESSEAALRVPDLLVQKGKAAYAVEVKAAVEGRGDRLVPLWSQAYLEAQRFGKEGYAPLAVVAAPRIPLKVAQHVLKLAKELAPGAAAGVVDLEGLRLFSGPHLDGLDRVVHEPLFKSAQGQAAINIFSDLNQWMLKVLLAPELPDRLLSAPRGSYRNASQLARAANVSVMTAFRFVQELQREGYLHESEPHLELVRRQDLFRRWQAASSGRVREVPMRFLLRRDPQAEIHRMLQGSQACVGLFAAADALGCGFVAGVPPYVYVRRLGRSGLALWKNLAPADGQTPDLILRQAPAPESVFRGAVRVGGDPVCDIVQVWLDVSGHPSRGREQADAIRRHELADIIEGTNGRG